MNTDYDDLRVLPDGTHSFETDQGDTFVFSTIRAASLLVHTDDDEAARYAFEKQTGGNTDMLKLADPDFETYPSHEAGLAGVRTPHGAHVFYSSATEMAVYVPPGNDATMTDVGRYLDEIADEKEIDGLLDISGVSERDAENLRDAGYTTVDNIRWASQSDLSEVSGIGNALAARIKADVGEPDEDEDDERLGELFG